MTDRRPSKRRRPSRPQPFLGFSPFARSLSLSLTSSSKRNPRDPPLSQLPSESNPKTSVRKHPLPTKRPSSVSDDEEDDEEEEGEEGQEMEIIQADFGFFDPKPGDFSGVKLLLQNYLGNKPWDLSGFVDLILEQTTVGTVVKSDADDDQEDDDVNEDGDEDGLYAVISALNLGRYAGHECMVELKKFLLEACGDENVKKLKTLLEEEANEVGLLVSQRFVNCPHQLVPPLYDALFDEVSWATEDEPTQELRDSFRFKYYLLLTRIYMNKKVDQWKTITSHDCNEPVVYIKAEDEIFQELSSFSFTFRLHDEKLAPYELRNYNVMGLVMVVNAETVPKFRERLKSLLAGT